MALLCTSGLNVSAAQPIIEVGGPTLFRIDQDGKAIGQGRLAEELSVGYFVQGKLQKWTIPPDAKQWTREGVTLKYQWGVIGLRAQAKGRDQVHLTVMMTNASPQPILGFQGLPLMDLDLPEEPQGHGWYEGHCACDSFDQIAYVPLDYGSGMAAIWLDSMDRIAQLQAVRQGDKSVHRFSVSLSSAPFIDARNESEIQPGQTREWDLTLGVAPARTQWNDLLRQPIFEFSRLHPPVFSWKDRRPIGQFVLGSQGLMHHSQTNPRGWFNDPNIDVKSPEGLAKFKDLAIKNAQRDVALLKAVNAQGAIVWDIEGDEYPSITYIGDPRKIKELDPEMDQVSDAFFKTFSDAGLRTGVCLRPSEIVANTKGTANGVPLAHRHMGINVVDVLCSKIDYARKRWGCSLFYVDSDLTYQYDYDGKVTSWILPASIFRTIAQRYPDILLVPEHSTLAYYANGAVYKEMNPHMLGNVFKTSDITRAVYPNSFTVIKVDPSRVVEKKSEIIQGQRGGDVLLAPAWWPSPEYNSLKQLREESGFLRMNAQ